MKPLAIATRSEVLDHPLIAQNHADPIHYIRCFPGDFVAAQAEKVLAWWLDNPSRHRAVEFGWIGPEGFDPERRDANGMLIGCTLPELAQGMLGRGFKRTRDTEMLREAHKVWGLEGVFPETIYINHEPWSTPSHTLAMTERARFNSLRINHFKDMLLDAGLYYPVSNIVIDFVQFSSRLNPYAWDYNGVRVPLIPPRRKFRSSAQFYSTPDGGATIKLAAWLASVPDPAIPLLQPANADMLADQLNLCAQHGSHQPILYFDEIFGGSIPWQLSEAQKVLAERRSNGLA